jgi:hypothetical protein
MRADLRAFLPALAIALALQVPVSVRAQQQLPPSQIPQTKFDTGQDVVPVYEGWIRNPDGTFDLVFGYFNRNYQEELVIPPGPDNMIEPGGPDRGQPTYFLPRRQARLFRVRVPKDWGDKVLTWTIKANGRTEKAYGDLLPVQEINEHIISSGGNSVAFGDEDLNKPPTIALAPVTRAQVSAPATLTATVTDDGLPKPPPRPTRQATTTTRDGAIQRQTNFANGPRARGLTVRWFEYGGPAKVTFDPPGAIPVTNGTAAVKARFASPGTYTLVAIASDGQLSERTTATITVEK